MKIIKKAVIGIFLNGLALYLITLILPEITYTGGFKFFVIAGIILGLINYFIKPVIKALSLPLVLITGGLFLIVINAFVLWFLSYFLDVAAFRDVTLSFPNMGSYVIGGFALGVINWAEHLFIKNK